VSDWLKGQILELTASGALSKGNKVTVDRNFSQSDRDNGYKVSCNYKGKNYDVTPSQLKEVKDPMWKKGQIAQVIVGGAISSGAMVTIEKDYSLNDLKRNNGVWCNHKNESFNITPHHLGDPS
jgi:hypothetical protein